MTSTKVVKFGTICDFCTENFPVVAELTLENTKKNMFTSFPPRHQPPGLTLLTHIIIIILKILFCKRIILSFVYCFNTRLDIHPNALLETTLQYDFPVEIDTSSFVAMFANHVDVVNGPRVLQHWFSFGMRRLFLFR